jgi:hypothetical protein
MDAGTTTPKTETSSMAALHRRERRASSAHEEFQQPQQIKNAENDKGIESETNNHYRDRPRNHRNAKLLIIFCVHAKLGQKPIMDTSGYINDGGNRQERDSYNEIC